MCENFGEVMMNYVVLVFTRGDALEDQSIEDVIKQSPKKLQSIVQVMTRMCERWKCDGG
jgi:hypothetical protein